MTELTPIRREIVVDAGPALAYRVFVDRIGAWWPVAELSVHGAGSTVSFTDGRIVEVATDGTEAVWGTVLADQPPGLLSFTWHPGRPAEPASRVTVTFEASGERTLVRLEHAGWEVFADPVAARQEYAEGWPAVLQLLATDVGDQAGATWVALLHQATEGVANVFTDERFREHIAFLQRCADAGRLVAAGSLADEPGAGMTVLRLTGPDRYDEAVRLATEDDRSVAQGLFTVTVRPWNVVLSR